MAGSRQLGQNIVADCIPAWKGVLPHSGWQWPRPTRKLLTQTAEQE
jgi:hypothetical protein